MLLFACLLALAGCGNKNDSAPQRPRLVDDRPKTPEEAQTRREARSLGSKLYAAARRAESAKLDRDQQQAVIEPINNDIEQFIFRRMEKYSGRITSIDVSYFHPAIQCIIHVTPGDDEELANIKRDADSLVGRIIEDLPIVKYLMVKNDAEKETGQPVKR